MILCGYCYCHLVVLHRNSHPEVFLEKGVLKICSKFMGGLCRSVISIKLQSTLRHGCSPLNLLQIFRGRCFSIVTQYSCAEAYSAPSQTSKMLLFAKMITDLLLLSIFAISYIVDVRLGSEYL